MSNVSTTIDRDGCITEWEHQYEWSVGVLFEHPWFFITGGHPGDSGAGGNTPQDPVAEGIQECHECGHKWWCCG